MNTLLMLLPIVMSSQIGFERHDIDAFPSGYQVAVADINTDGRPDVVALSTRADRVDWYENGNWRKHVVTRSARNIDLAFHDLDGDGKLELALAAGFYFDESSRGGELFLLQQPTSPDDPWPKWQIAADPVVHRVRWGDLDGDGHKELVHAPLFGPGSQGAVQPKPAHLWAFQILQPWRPGQVHTMKIDETLTVLHAVHVGDLDADDRDEILTASFEGIFRFDLEGELKSGPWKKTQISSGAPPVSKEAGAPRGSSEVAPGKLADGVSFIAAIEPWHGQQLVVYMANGADQPWRRQLLDDRLEEGHALVVANFDRDDSDEIVVGWRGGEGGLRLYDAIDNKSRFRRIAIDRGIAVEGMVASDINLDGRLDLVAIGGRTNDLVWYENRTR